MFVVYTDEERAFIANARAGGMPLRTVQDHFNARFENRPTPSKWTISSVYKKFLETGCALLSHKKYERPNQRISEEVQVQVCAAAEVRNGENFTTRSIAADLGISKSSVASILKKNKYYPYRLQRHQELRNNDTERRSEFCNSMLQELDFNANMLQNICFTDESKFVLKQGPNRQNNRFWATSPPTQCIPIYSQYQQKINVWAGMYGTDIIGPFFYEENLTGPRYLQLLQQQIIPAIEAIEAQRGVSFTNILFFNF